MCDAPPPCLVSEFEGGGTQFVHYGEEFPGASCDWERTRFTMEDDLSDAVIDVFIDLHKKGLVYRGLRMVNWDPVALTAVSDEEVIHKELSSKLYHIRYKIDQKIRGSEDQTIG